MAMLEGDLEALLLALGRKIGAQDAMGWLRDRWSYFDEVSPQLVMVDTDHLRTAGSRDFVWVPADLISYIADDRGWGETDTRPETTYRWFMNGLITADEGSIKDWIRAVGHPPLVQIAGPYGPLYQTGSDGRHRTAILKALEIQWQYDVRPERGLEVGEQFLILVNTPIPALLPQEHRRHEQAVTDQLEHLELLTKAGLVEPVGRTYAHANRSYMLAASLPFPWALKQPAAVAVASRRYKQSYRDFGVTKAEHVSLDADTWSEYLSGLAEQRRPVRHAVQNPLAKPGIPPVDNPGSTRILA